MPYEIFVVAMFVLFLAVDFLFSFRDKSQPVAGRWLSNYALYLINWMLERGFVILAILAFIEITDGRFGLFTLIDLPIVIVALASLLILDLTSYAKHWIKHRWQLLWRFHRVHHSDRDYDFTTGLRFHPFEKALDDGSVLLTVLLLGMPLEAYMAYVYIITAHNYFVHSNIALPSRLDSWLTRIIVTPNMHRVHHAEPRQLCDTNYGVLFSIWDRLFGTIKHVDDQKSIQTGIVAYTRPDQLSFFQLLALPFRPINGSGQASTAK